MNYKEGAPDPLEIRRDALLKRLVSLREHPRIKTNSTQLSLLTNFSNNIQKLTDDEGIAKGEEFITTLENALKEEGK